MKLIVGPVLWLVTFQHIKAADHWQSYNDQQAGYRHRMSPLGK